MNILITSPDLNSVGGIPSVVNNILTLNTPPPPSGKVKRLNYFHLKVGRNSYNVNKLLWILNQFTLIYRFFYKVYKHKIHLIHINTAINTTAIIRDAVLCILSNLLNKKSVLYIHGGKYFWDTNINFILRLFVRIMLRLSGKVIVLSNKERTYLSDKYNPDLSADKAGNIGIKVLPYCVLRHFAKININKNKEITEILFLGRFHPDKGIKEIIDSLRLLNSRTKNFRFILCGDGPKKQNIVKFLSELLNNRFRYEGVVKGDKKDEILRRADILLLPSYYEAMPMSILEAMAYGCVPVVTDVGSVNTVIKHNNNGFFVKKQDHYDIADKLQYLINNKAVLQQLSINAYQTIKKHYSCDNYINNLIQIYEE